MLHCRPTKGQSLNLLLFVAFSCLGGCVASYPQDIRLVSVAPASSNDIPGYPHRSPDRLALKLTFQSSFDLADYTQDSYGTAVSAMFCDTALQFRDYVGSPAPSLAWNSVYADDGQLVTSKKFTRDLPEGINRERYYAFLFVARTLPPPGQWSHPDHSWDLQADPHDVCVRITTLKEYILLRTRSDVMRIPASVTRAALGQIPIR